MLVFRQFYAFIFKLLDFLQTKEFSESWVNKLGIHVFWFLKTYEQNQQLKHYLKYIANKLNFQQGSLYSTIAMSWIFFCVVF